MSKVTINTDLIVSGDITLHSSIKDSSGSAGTNGYVLTSTGTGWSWSQSQSGAGTSLTNGNNYSNIIHWDSSSSEWVVNGSSSLAIGHDAGLNNQGTQSIAIGYQTGYQNQRTQSIAIGYQAGYENQGQQSVAIGLDAGYNNQGTQSISIGYRAGRTNQGTQSVAIGLDAGYENQGQQSVAIGYQAGNITQGQSAVAIGYNAGNSTQSENAVAIGNLAGEQKQGAHAIGIGILAGHSTQGQNAVAIGNQAGNSTQGLNAVAIGFNAGNSTQGQSAVAIGSGSGFITQGQTAIAIGNLAGYSTQYQSAVAIGYQAGYQNQGTQSVAIGYQAGITNQSQNSIAINASDNYLAASNSGFYAAPIRNINQTTVLGYDTSSKEITHYTPFGSHHMSIIKNGHQTIMLPTALSNSRWYGGGKITNWTVISESSSQWSSNNHDWTCPSSGNYLIFGNIIVSDGNSNLDGADIRIYKNNSYLNRISWVEYSRTSTDDDDITYANLPFHSVINLSQGNTIYFDTVLISSTQNSNGSIREEGSSLTILKLS